MVGALATAALGFALGATAAPTSAQVARPQIAAGLGAETGLVEHAQRRGGGESLAARGFRGAAPRVRTFHMQRRIPAALPAPAQPPVINGPLSQNPDSRRWATVSDDIYDLGLSWRGYWTGRH